MILATSEYTSASRSTRSTTAASISYRYSMPCGTRVQTRKKRTYRDSSHRNWQCMEEGPLPWNDRRRQPKLLLPNRPFFATRHERDHERMLRSTPVVEASTRKIVTGLRYKYSLLPAARVACGFLADILERQGDFHV